MKKWYQSKTMWVAILTAVSGILAVFEGSDATGSILVVLGVVNAILRAITTEPIE